jgi:site-specific recombinase XerC
MSNPTESNGIQGNPTTERQKTTESKRQKTTEFQPPRGIVYFLRPKCPARAFAVQWRVEGVRREKGFRTKADRETFARSLAGDVKSIGVSAYRLDESEARAWRAFVAEVSPASLSEVAAHWRATGRKEEPAVSAAVADFIAAKEGQGISPAALSHYKKWLGRFSVAFGARRVSTVTREEISAWLPTLGLGAVTTRGHLTRVRGLFSWLVICGQIARNPCAGIKAPKIVGKDVEVYSLAQGRALFEKNAGESRELLGRLALEAFAGLRFASAAVIAAADIKTASGGIVLPADKIKTERREFIDGLPANLWAWLAWSKPEAWSMTPRAYLAAKSNARVRAGLPEVRNALRHSFCSYHIAAHKDPSRTSVILCHSSPRMLWRHYRGNATAEDGAAWFEIMPPAK